MVEMMLALQYADSIPVPPLISTSTSSNGSITLKSFNSINTMATSTLMNLFSIMRNLKNEFHRLKITSLHAKFLYSTMNLWKNWSHHGREGRYDGLGQVHYCCNIYYLYYRRAKIHYWYHEVHLPLYSNSWPCKSRSSICTILILEIKFRPWQYTVKTNQASEERSSNSNNNKQHINIQDIKYKERNYKVMDLVKHFTCTCISTIFKSQISNFRCGKYSISPTI